jgi:hypothetical protein
MSQLGHKRTSASIIKMSALSLKTDIRQTSGEVRFLWIKRFFRLRQRTNRRARSLGD